MTCARVAAVVVLLGGALSLSIGCEAPQARAAQAPPARADQAAPGSTAWRTLGTWTGNGNRQTESFDVTTGALRLRWDTRPTATATAAGAAGAGPFRVWLYSAISGRPLQLVVEQPGPGAGTAHVADDPRVSYLVIESEQVDWTATLDEGVAPTTRP